jgi:SAM-dependent methyltransferase
VATLQRDPIGHAWLGPSPPLWRRRQRLQHQASGATLALTSSRDVPLLAAAPSSSIDSVLSVLTLCSVDDLDGTLREVHRVLRPGGQFLFLEHVPDWPGARRPADLVGPTWRLMGGCDARRDVPEAVRRAGLILGDIERFTVPTVAVPLRHFVAGAAVRAEEVS